MFKTTRFLFLVAFTLLAFTSIQILGQGKVKVNNVHSISHNVKPAGGSFGQIPFSNGPRSSTITESITQNIVSGNSVACNNGVATTANSYFRSFVLSNFGITNDFQITNVSIGIESAIGASGMQPITCYLYTTSTPFPTGYPSSLTLIGSATVDVPDQELTIFNIPVLGIAPAGSEIVVEIFTPDGQSVGNLFFIGSNPDGETAPSYIMAVDCGISVPMTTASIGFPGMNIVMNVTGTDEFFFDNFDSYTAGQRLACQNPTDWTTWDNLPCNAVQDPFISNTYAYSGANSVKIVQNNDLVRVNGPKTAGKWYMSFLFYIPSGKSGYFNTLSEYTLPSTFGWGMECYFNAGGGGQLLTDITTNFTWQAGVWNQVMVVVDLDTHLAEFWIGAGALTQIATWDWTQSGTILNQLAANDFFGAVTTNEMYMDNYYFSDVMPPIVQLSNDVGTQSIDLATQIAPGVVAPLATVKNYGILTNSFNVQMTITGGYSSTKAVSNLAPGATTQVTFDNWTAATGGYTINVCTQLGADQNTANDCFTRDIYVWDTGGDWTSGSVYPTTTYLGGGVGVVGYIYSIGGNTASLLGTECYKYNVATNTWSPIASLPAGRRVLAVAASGNFVYAIGGSDMASVYQSTVYKYDIAGNSWSTVAPLPLAIGWGKAVGYSSNYIYFAGGVDAASNYLSNVYLYNVSANTWTAATSMPGPKFGGAFSVVGDKLVYAAGADPAGISNIVYVGIIDAGNPALIAWTTMENPYPGVNKQLSSQYDANLAALIAAPNKSNTRSPEAVSFPAGSMYRFDAAPWGTDAIIVAGGSPTSAWLPSDPNPCYIYKPGTDAWIAQENVPIPVLGSSLGTINSGDTWKLVVASGLTLGGVATNSTQIFTNTLGATTFQLSVPIANGWNMVSVPGINPDGQGINNWWINHTGTVYKFVPGSGYTGIATTTPGEGYWMKNAGAETYNYPAIQIVPHNPINVASGWNMFGGYEDIVDVTALNTTPPGQIVSIYKFIPGQGYQPATQIVPGYGYWVKVSSACQINIPDVSAKGNQKAAEMFKDDLPDGKAGWGKITVTDAAGSSYTLYTVKGEVDLDLYELPPLPPAGLFDVRFGSGRAAEDISSTQSIDMRGATYPVRIKVENIDITLQDESGKVINTVLKPGQEIIVNNSLVTKLFLSGKPSIPTDYSLDQNYPNPFNPVTTLNFSIPQASNVTLTIFNMLGQKVSELVNGKLEAGRYSYQWNARNVATGMYIYELRTEKFVSIKKMLLLK